MIQHQLSRRFTVILDIQLANCVWKGGNFRKFQHAKKAEDV